MGGPLHPPPEVYERWIEMLREDRVALKTCTLACREWVPLSQRYLFEHVRVQGAPRWLRFLHLLESSASKGSDVGRYIRKFELIDISLGCALQPLFEDIVRRIGHRRMPNVEHLSLRGWDWVSVVERAQDHDPESVPRRVLKGLFPFNKLIELELIDNVTRYPHIIPQLFTFFPCLSILRLKDVRLSADAPIGLTNMPLEREVQVIVPIKIQEFHLHGQSSDYLTVNLLDFIVKPPFQLALRTLDLSELDIPLTGRSVSDMLMRSTETIQHLCITHQFIHLLNLSHFAQLHFISLHWCVSTDISVADDIQALFSDIAGHCSLRVVEMRFSLMQSHRLVEEQMPFAGLDAILLALHSRCPAIAVRFHFSFHVFVKAGNMLSRPQITPLLKASTGLATAAGLHATVTSHTTFWGMPGNVEGEEALVEEMDLSGE
ncbi:uncharacterized protein C8Q71DRAFT_774610 [Rhodofomes roseus]|uniref:F-box domain-containing protein n=1 Tax=Rhodofomes roseus TaxID=34475 RepID=A0A4Y9Y4B6_9APHY|nr:uncharacterized protein C8Q71DRAFT_774610 [Rhodofomes roseus]KAH9833201.1 hypothetical protein C8Q71DRAFT_774610 [Rhodofomes roseus]TFY56271.1 hypothetical protein EVJ58_g7739 [Rhodofomes roseus]